MAAGLEGLVKEVPSGCQRNHFIPLFFRIDLEQELMPCEGKALAQNVSLPFSSGWYVSLRLAK